MNMRNVCLLMVCFLVILIPISDQWASPVAAADEQLCYPIALSSTDGPLAPRQTRTTVQSLFADSDSDGLSDAQEIGGWDNAAGHFTTDPVDGDSDNDGLTDGEEKLFDTDPNDSTSPGIYVLYNTQFKTSQYFGWKQYGDQFIAFSTAVVRRGSYFVVGGPSGATMSIGKSTSGLSTLTTSGTDCMGRWKISVPSGGTVGKYTITLTKGSWSKSLTLDVIFQLDTNLSAADLQAYAYSDDPSNTRDAWAIWYLSDDDSNNESASHPGYHYARGRGFAFENDQYLAYVFQNHIMPAINGYTDRGSAANAIGHEVDDTLRFEADTVPLTMYAALHSYHNQAQCSIHAAVLTAFLRGAGIASRPVAVDWDMTVRPNALMDTATEVWLSGDWKVMRAWKYHEPYPGPMNQGIYPLTDRHSWGQTMYPPEKGDLLLVAASSWVWDQVQTGWIANNPTDYVFANWQTSQILRWDWVNTVVIPYGWGWNGEPVRVGGPYDLYDDWPNILSNSPVLNVASSSAKPERVLRAAALPVAFFTSQVAVPSLTQAQPVQLGNITGSKGVDLNGNGRFDQLVIQLEVTAAQAGSYTIGGALDSADPTVRASTSRLATAYAYVSLKQGTQIVQLPFDGQTLFKRTVDGPYRVNTLWIKAGAPDPDPQGTTSGPLQIKQYNYFTAPYHAKDFEPLGGAGLTDQYQEQGTQARVTGRYKSLTLSVGFTVSTPGKFTVRGSLYDRQGKLIQEATWSGSQSPALLNFDRIAGRQGPYQLRNVYVLDGSDQIIDTREVAYTTQQVTSSAGKTQLLTPGEQLPAGARISLPNIYSDSGVDRNGNRLYDSLVISATLDVAPEEAGLPYRIEGFLKDGNSSVVAYAVSNPQVLAEGQQSLSLEFDGRTINEHGVDGPFTLIAVRILAGDSYTVLDEVPVAYTTGSYNHDQFETRPQRPGGIVFQDDMESGSDKWTAADPWSLADGDSTAANELHSLTHAWRASASSSKQGSLTTMELNLTSSASPILRFKTCYHFGSSDRGYVEATGDGVTWTRVLTLTGASPHWSMETIDLSDWGKIPNAHVRFRAAAQSSLLWFVDDVSIDTTPSITSVSFATGPEPFLVGADIRFTASYTSSDMTIPVSYTWTLDGSSPIQSSSPQMTHQFSSPGPHDVQLAVESIYDRTVVSRVLQVYQPVTHVTFDTSPQMPDEGERVTFTLSYQPVTASRPVTYTLDFGDGSQPVTTNNNTVTHAFDKRGSYSVMLTATNGYSVPVTYTRRVDIDMLFFYLPLISR